MEKHTKDNMLINVNDNNIFHKFKNFLYCFFHKKDMVSNSLSNKSIIGSNDNIQNNSSDTFLESIKNIENDETKLLKLQKQYRNGEINEEELTEEQIHSLCSLYDKQIESIRKSNEVRKQKLLQYRNQLKINN